MATARGGLVRRRRHLVHGQERPRPASRLALCGGHRHLHGQDRRVQAEPAPGARHQPRRQRHGRDHAHLGRARALRRVAGQQPLRGLHSHERLPHTGRVHADHSADLRSSSRRAPRQVQADGSGLRERQRYGSHLGPSRPPRAPRLDRGPGPYGTRRLHDAQAAHQRQVHRHAHGPRAPDRHLHPRRHDVRPLGHLHGGAHGPRGSHVRSAAFPSTRPPLRRVLRVPALQRGAEQALGHDSRVHAPQQPLRLRGGVQEAAQAALEGLPRPHQARRRRGHVRYAGAGRSRLPRAGSRSPQHSPAARPQGRSGRHR